MTDSDKKSPLDEDYLDNSDLGSDVDEDMDFDADGDDGIFLPGEQRKGKSARKLTYIVIVLSLLSGGAFYFYNKQDKIVAPVIANIPAIETASQALPVVPTPASDFDAATSTTLSDIVLNQTEESVDLPDVPTAPPGVDGLSQSGGALDTASPNLNDPIQPVTPDVPEDVKAENEKVVPDTAKLQPVSKTPVIPKKNELEAARETINTVEKKAPPEKTVYFDSPKGKTLIDIPPPSINPMGEPGESIIIVHKDGRNSDDLIVEKGEDNGFIESKLVNASRAASLGRYDAALGFYKEMYKKNPRDPRILMGRAVTLQKLGETQPAIGAYKELLNIEPNNPEAITNLMGLIGKTQPAVALQNLLDLREKYPRNPDVAAQLGVAYTQSGNPQDGLKYLNMAAGLQPQNPQHLFNMAVIYERLNDREKAIKYYEQALDVFSVNGSGTNTAFSREQIYDRLSALR